MKQNLSIFVLMALSTTAFAAGQSATQSVKTVSVKRSASHARVLKTKSTNSNDFIDATKQSGPAPQAAHAPQAPQATKISKVPNEPQTARSKALGTSMQTAVKAVEEAPTFKFGADLKNTFTMARKEQLELIGGEAFQNDTEAVVTAKHKSGFGLGLSAIWRTKAKADIDNVNQRRDASVFLMHPTLYKTPNFSIDGKFRVFIPTSDWSQANDFFQARYYNMMSLDLGNKFSAFNMFMPFYFSQKNPGPTDSPFFMLAFTELTHQTLPWLSLSLGQQTQIESHYGTATGTTVEIYPFADITIVPHLVIEPKFYMPLFVSNVVGGAPSSVSVDQTQFELFVKLSI